jgi:hypothetical protein
MHQSGRCARKDFGGLSCCRLTDTEALFLKNLCAEIHLGFRDIEVRQLPSTPWGSFWARSIKISNNGLDYVGLYDVITVLCLFPQGASVAPVQD